MNKQRKTSHILNVFQYDPTTGIVTLPSSLIIPSPDSTENSTKVATTAWIREYVGSLGYATSAAVTSSLTNYLALTGGTLSGGIYINPTNTSVVGLDIASNTIRFRSDNVEGFKRQLVTTLSSGTLVKMLAAGYGGTYVTDLGFYTSSNAGENALPNIYLTGGNNYVGINTVTPQYNLDVAGTGRYTSTLIASSFVKSGGTSAQYLMADGSVSAGPSLAGYVPTSRTITINGTAYDLSADRAWSIASGVTSFNTRTGAITLTSGDVTGALGFTPYNSSNPSGYVTSTTADSTYLKGTTNPGTPGNFALSIGNNGTYSYVQSHNSQPLELNPLGNAVRIAGQTVIHSGNIGSQSVSLSSQVTINYNNDSNSTYQLLWGSGNSVYGTSQVYINPSSDVIYARGGYISPGNPWGTSDSAFFPNGITTAGSNNWIYGNTYLGNAPANGAGHQFFTSGSSYSTGDMEAGGSMRAPIFYDRNDTGYYLDMNSTSNSAGRIRGGILFGPNPTWGAYLRVGADGNPDTSVCNVAATNGNLHIDSKAGYAMYLNNYANGNIYFNGGTYYINSNGSYYNGTASYANSAGSAGSLSGFDKTNPSFGAVYADNWFRAYNDCGLYSQSYGGHLRRSLGSSFGNWETFGYERNSWSGFCYVHNYLLNIMSNTSGDHGFYQENGNGWTLFYNRGNNCWGIGTDNTYSGDGFRCVKYGSSQYGWTTWSDRRAKENISSITGALDTVRNMRGVYFNYISDEAKNKRVGFIAQELELVLPEAVRYAEEIDEYNVEYAQIVSVLTEAIKEQDVKMTAQEAKIQRLEQLVEQLINQ